MYDFHYAGFPLSIASTKKLAVQGLLFSFFHILATFNFHHGAFIQLYILLTFLLFGFKSWDWHQSTLQNHVLGCPSHGGRLTLVLLWAPDPGYQSVAEMKNITTISACQTASFFVLAVVAN